MKKHKKLIITLCSVITVMLAVFIGCVVYVSDYYHAEDTAIMAMTGTQDYAVEERGGNIIFIPAEPVAGLIYYPGGKVEHTAYAPLMAEFAKQGVLCVLIEMPFRLAVLDVNAADGIQDNFPEIEKWYIGGHSLGGAMAASYISNHTSEFDGLLLLGAYSTADISDSGLSVISVYGSKDKVLNMEKYKENREKLPSGFTELIIDGGCHSYFGNYGHQDGDGEPNISMEEQVRQTVEAFVEATNFES